MKVSTIIHALTLAGTCASLPITNTGHHTTQRVPAALPTNSAGEMVFPHGMNGHTIHPMPTEAANHTDRVSTVHEARNNGDSAPGEVHKILEAIYPDLEGRAADKAPFPHLHGAKNRTVDTPDHGYLPPDTHHHPRDNMNLAASNRRHLPPWKFHHGPQGNQTAEVAVDHRHLPPWILHRPTTTLATLTVSTATSNAALEAAASTAVVILG
ncbi:hypothetical protein MMC18_005052 [Xylographa bjoerkii]|nr:hypothetical protein [Xylographa bjoerkii]